MNVQQRQQKNQQSRKGRKRHEPQEKDIQDSSTLTSSIPDIGTGTSARTKNWTRSLSPRRSFFNDNNNNNNNNTIVPSPFDDTTLASHYLSVSHQNVVAPVLNSLKRLTSRTTRSQSPRRRRDVDIPSLSTADVATASNLLRDESSMDKIKTDSKQLTRISPKAKRDSQSRPTRINSAPVTSSTEGQLQLLHQETSLLGQTTEENKPQRSRSDLMIPSSSSSRKHRSRSPRHSMEQKKESGAIATTTTTKSTLKPPSGLNLIKRNIKEDVEGLHNDGKVEIDSRIKDNNFERNIPTNNPRSRATAQLSSKSPSRPKSRRKLVINAVEQKPSSARSLTMPPPRKPLSDPGTTKSGRATSPSKNSVRPLLSSTQKRSLQVHKPSSGLALSSQHEKPSSDPGRYNNASQPISQSNYNAGPSTAQQQTLSLSLSLQQLPPPDGPSQGGSLPLLDHQSSADTAHSANSLMVDRIPPSTPVIINRPNLNKEALQHVADVKESIRKMRTQQYSQRHKLKFDGGRPIQPNIMTTMTTSNGKSAPPPASPVVVVPTSAVSLQDSHQHSSGSLVTTAVVMDPHYSSSRLHGIITVEELEVGHMKTPAAIQRALTANALVPERIQIQEQGQEWDTKNKALEEEHAEKVESLTRAIRKSKKLIKRCCGDVWMERDEIVHLQRTNWSIRKSLLQTDAPKDTITTLNLKLEQTLRQEREITAELEDYQDEKQQLELECSQLAKTIEEYKNLLDNLNTQVVPLFPTCQDVDDGTVEAYFPPEGPKATAAAVIYLLDDDDFSDSIHSTDG
jgi:hypothetical protein